jgi:hypothetical protein
MFFIFDVLKHLVCILYILVNHVWYLLQESLSDFFEDFFFEGLWAFLGSSVSYIIVLWESSTGYPFSLLPSEFWIIIIFFEESGFHPFFLLLYLLCNYVLDRVVGCFSHLFSFPWFSFCVVNVLVISYIGVLFPSLAWRHNLAKTNSYVQCPTSCLYIL